MSVDVLLASVLGAAHDQALSLLIAGCSQEVGFTKKGTAPVSGLTETGSSNLLAVHGA